MPDTLRIPTVECRRSWGHAWQRQRYLYATEVERAAAPAVSTATLEWDYGRMLDADGGVARARPLALGGLYVRISDPVTGRVVFVGRVDEEADHPDGPHAGNPTPTGRQEFRAEGIEGLLAGADVIGSIVDDGDGNARRIDTMLPFNADADGTLVGNRSNRRIDGSYVFSATDAALWTALDVAEYLLAQWAPASIGWSLSGATGNLEQMVRSWRPPRTVMGGLNDVIDRRRGAGWTCDHDHPSPRIYVFATFGSSIEVPQADGQPVTLSPSGERITMDTDVNSSLVGQLSITRSTAHAYEAVMVRGGPVISVNTLTHDNGGLTAGWSPELAHDYATVDGGGFEANDDARLADRFRDVFGAFVVGDSWRPYVPSIAADGRLQTQYDTYIDGVRATHRIERALGPEWSSIPVDTTPQPWFAWGKQLLRDLPLRQGDVWSSGELTRAEADSDRRSMAVWIRLTGADGAERNVPIDRLDPERHLVPPMHALPLDDRLGIRVKARPNHVLAADDWPSDATPTDSEPLLRWREMTATVAIATDVRLTVTRPIQRGAGRVLQIDMPQAQAHVVAAGTAVDIDADGQLVTVPRHTVLRNDRHILGSVAALAAAWYGKTRNAATWTVRRISSVLLIGEFCAAIVAGGQRHTINAPVTRVTYTWSDDGHTTQYRTDYDELDFVDLAAGPSAGGGAAAMSAGTIAAPLTPTRSAPLQRQSPISNQLAEVPPRRAVLRWGIVLDGRETTPSHERIYPVTAGETIEYEGYWFDEIDPKTGAVRAVGVTRDAAGDWIETQARRYVAGVNYSHWLPLRVGSVFRFVSVTLDDGSVEHRILADTFATPLIPVTLEKDGGAAGGDASPGYDADDDTTWDDCSWTYTVYAADGVTVLAEEATPAGARIEKTAYYYAGEDAAHTATGYGVMGASGLDWFVAPGEQVKYETCETT